MSYTAPVQGRARASAWVGGAEWVLFFLCFAVIGWRSLNLPTTADSHGYETAAWLLLTQGMRPYVDFIHSQGPFYLWWGGFWYFLTGGWFWAFRLSAFVSYGLCMALTLGLLHRAGYGPVVRLGVMAAVFLTPVSLFGGWQFLGMNEMMAGVLMALWGMVLAGRARPWLVGVGLAVALCNRMMALPLAAGLMVTLLLQDRDAFLRSLLCLVVVTVILHLPVWWGGGWRGWLDQSVLFHTKKDVVMVNLWGLRARKLFYVMPLVWGLVWTIGRVRPPWLVGMGGAALVALVGMLQQPVIGSYYLMPFVLVLLVLMAGAEHRMALPVVRQVVGWLPAGVLSGWLVITAILPLPRTGNVPGLAAACRSLRQAVAPGAMVLVEASISWPVLDCARVFPWGGMTDTNLMLFGTLLDYNGFMGRLETFPPQAMVLYQDNGLSVIPGFLDHWSTAYERLPLPQKGNFIVLVRRSEGLDSPRGGDSVTP